MPESGTGRMEWQEELVRLIALDIRLRVGNQGEVIRALRKLGFSPKRIADLLGTTPGTVNQELVRARQKVAKRNARQDSPG